ncbi:LysR family transcriptional regulator [Pyxidicoccus parkwayensis]|uniref:LysR family transcriptional regulator n=1 Tax=Pyxidicoccus parkwayensis TaxID=2813578 RepID=A0ABX7PAL5_9BACT|nr:LysR family transcriptional regulator [Pyxidicoccus parkwaysis]QSQ27487.1 LysR family transcriptional regulator [Pyxidicoccus parkwaysis]
MLDWDDLRFFLAVAQHGSLSSAARTLRVTQPTVGRRLDALERRLGSRLFQRTPSGFTLTTTGESIRAHVERMEQDALAAERQATGRDIGLSGTVRVSTTEWFASHVLGPLLVPLTGKHPALGIELHADVRRVSLTQREADLALRVVPFEQQDIFQRKVARVGFGLYASEDYLARHGAPDFSRQCEGHALVTMSDELGPIADTAWLRELASRARIAFRLNNRDVQARVAISGAGLACLPRCLGDAMTELRRLATPTPPPARDLWLGVHRDLRATPRVKEVADFIAGELRRLGPTLNPEDVPKPSRRARPPRA